MIKSVSLQNVKGHNRSFDLGPTTLIVGDNFSGKSGLFQAIALGLHGWLKHPSGDKQLAPMGMASGNPMSITLDTSLGTISRAWTRDKRGSVKYSGYAGEELVPPILLDPRTFLDLSADKRMRYVFSAIRIENDTFNGPGLIAELKNIKLETNTEATEQALNDVIAVVSASWDGFTTEQEMNPSITVQDWLATLSDDLKSRLQLAKQAVDRMAKTVSGLTELKLQDPAEFDRNTAAAESELKHARTDLSDVENKLGVIHEKMRAATANAKRFDQLQREIITLPTPDLHFSASLVQELRGQEEMVRLKILEDNQRHGVLLGEVRALEESLKRYRATEESIMHQNAAIAKIPDQTETIKELDAALVALQPLSMESAERDAYTSWQSEQSNLRIIQAEIHAAEQVEAEMLKRLSALPSLTECPWCKSAGTDFHAAAQAHFERTLADTRTTLEHALAKEHATRTRCNELYARKEEIITSKNATRGEVIVLANRLKEADHLRRTRAELEAKRDGLEQSLGADVTEDLARTRSNAVALRETIEAGQKRHAEILAQLGEIAKMEKAQQLRQELDRLDPPNLDDLNQEHGLLTARKATVRETIDKLQTAIKLATAAKGDAMRQAQALAERDKAQVDYELTKKAMAATTAFQQRMVDQAFASIMGNVNLFTAGILSSPLVYKDGEIGCERNGVWCGHEYLSGTEQALAFAAISVALAMQSPFRLVQIDELTRLSAVNKPKVMARMLELIRSGVIHQGIFVDTTDAPYSGLPGLTVIQL